MSPGEPPGPEVLEVLTFDALRQIVFDSNAEPQAKFLADWTPHIDEAIQSIVEAYSQLQIFRKSLEGDLRIATVERFLHSCIYSLVAALHHLVSGYPVAAGHMMRHFYESFAMVALCVDPASQVLEEFTKDRRRYRVDQAPNRLRRPKQAERLKSLVGFDVEGWGAHLDKNTDFGGRSHATALTLAFQGMLETENLFVLGGEYDHAKANAYEADLVRIRAGGENLTEFTSAATKALAGGLESDT